jgi:hypothetical protein
MAKASIPHSSEWFAELRSRNPQQAMMTEHIVKLSGTEQCCGICGQTHDLSDYIGDEGMSARLCNDCKTNQERMFGAMFFPLT